MTESEAIKEFNKMVGARMRTQKGISEKQHELFQIAMDSLEEIQQYRTIGTVTECREAMEKQKVLKPQEVLLHSGRKGYECKNCGNELSTSPFESAYCHWCGQRLE